MAVQYRKPVDDNVPWDQRLANYAGNKDAGKSEYQRALEVYRGKSALGDTEGANSAKKWADQVNTSIGGIGDNIVSNRADQINKTTDTIGQKVNADPYKFTTPESFKYDTQTIQSDPLYQAALRQAQSGAQTATNNAMVGLGSRGIGNSSVAVDRANQIQQSAIGHVNDTIMPQLMSQAYQRYRDTVGDQRTTEMNNYQSGQDQIKNLTGYTGTLNGLNQQETDNQYRDKAFGEQQKQNNIDLAKWGTQMYGYGAPKSDGGVFFDQYKGATTLPVQQFEYGKQQDATQNTAQYLGQYQGMPTMQKIMQDNSIRNMNADNVRAAASEARAAGNQALGVKFDTWDRMGVAPEGIPGVAAGTPLAGKTSSANTSESYSKYLDNTVAKYDSEKKLINPEDVMNSIELSGLSDYEKYKLYKERGLTWDDPIPAAPGK